MIDLKNFRVGIVTFEHGWRNVTQVLGWLSLLILLWFVVPSSSRSVRLQAQLRRSSKQSAGINLPAVTALERGRVSSAEAKVVRSDSLAKVYPGLTLIPQSGSERVLLVNEAGRIVHHWQVDSPRVRLLPNCHILALHGTKWGAHVEPWESLRQVVREYDWNGQVVWEYRAPELLHHDVRTLANGNLLLLTRRYLNAGERAKMPWLRFVDATVRADVVLEVSRSGNVVNLWDATKFLDLNSCGRISCSNRGKAPVVDWTHINTVSVLPENKWFDAGDTRFRPGNLLLMLRNWSTAVIVDRVTQQVVWEYQGDHRGGLSGGHEAEMIGPELPSSGNILIFDNGRTRAQSTVLEIDPTSKQVVWLYENGNQFFSKAAGASQRLPNGNTLISEDLRGRVFEVSPSGAVVWSYETVYRGARAKKYSRDFCSELSAL